MTDASMIREYLEWRASREGVTYGTAPEEFALEVATEAVLGAVGDYFSGGVDPEDELKTAYERYNRAVEALSANSS